MKAISVERVGVNADGTEQVRAFICASATPTVLPTTGSTVDGMNGNQRFAPFSILYVVENADAKVYIADESGAFIAQ